MANNELNLEAERVAFEAIAAKYQINTTLTPEFFTQNPVSPFKYAHSNHLFAIFCEGAARAAAPAQGGLSDALPELPKAQHLIEHYHDDGGVTFGNGYTEDDMRAYAKEYAAIVLRWQQGGVSDAWISVEDRLPEDGVYVWAHWCGAGDWNEDPRMGEARRACGGWQPAGSAGFDWNVTHWKPLPAPPVAAIQAQAGEAPTSTEPSPVNNWTALNEVVLFLMGAEPLEGVIFGERHPTKAGLFWWRLNLRAAMCRAKG